ncbi:MAG: DUF6663 family protein [Salinigranum sp.]
MAATTSGRYRVLDSHRDGREFLLVHLDDESFEPTVVEATGYDGALADGVAALRPGYVVEAALDWDGDGNARFAALSVERRSLFAFVDDVTGLFEAALGTWREAAASGDAMNSRVTRNTDGEPNGVLYVFAEQRGARDLFAEFRNGTLPIEPLVSKVEEGRDDDGEREVFVMRPADEPFVLVYVVFRKGGLLADTIRDTYDCPRTVPG